MEWIALNQCRQSKLFMPRPYPHETNKILLLNREDLGRLARFLTGHNFTRRHQAIVHKLPPEEALCRFCNEVGIVEDPFHIIKRCPQFSDQRQEIFEKPFLTWEICSWEAVHEFISKKEISELETVEEEL